MCTCPMPDHLEKLRMIPCTMGTPRNTAIRSAAGTTANQIVTRLDTPKVRAGVWPRALPAREVLGWDAVLVPILSSALQSAT